MAKVLSSSGRWLVTPPEGYKGKTYIGGRYVFQYRLLMEKRIGRLLLPNEEVHHINGIKTDDREENLKIEISHEHHLLHGEQLKGKNNCICSNCGSKFHLRPCYKKQNSSGLVFCSRDCYRDYVKYNNWGINNPRYLNR